MPREAFGVDRVGLFHDLAGPLEEVGHAGLLRSLRAAVFLPRLLDLPVFGDVFEQLVGAVAKQLSPQSLRLALAGQFLGDVVATVVEGLAGVGEQLLGRLAALSGAVGRRAGTLGLLFGTGWNRTAVAGGLSRPIVSRRGVVRRQRHPTRPERGREGACPGNETESRAQGRVLLGRKLKSLPGPRAVVAGQVHGSREDPLGTVTCLART